MENTSEQQAPKYKVNWFDRHKVITCFSILVLFLSGSALFGSFPRTSNQTAVQGVSTSIAPATPTTQPTATPTLLPSDTPTLTPSPIPTTYIAPTTSTVQTVQPTATQEQGLSNNNYDTNSSGNEVHSPATANDGSIPVGATALCNDGTPSYAQYHQGACSHHGGVKQFYN